jgi:hypothetical protein
MKELNIFLTLQFQVLMTSSNVLLVMPVNFEISKTETLKTALLEKKMGVLCS